MTAQTGMHATDVQVLRSLDMLRTRLILLFIITKRFIDYILVIAMVVVIEVCQLHTVRNIARECNLEVFGNLLTNWAARKILL